eukprot:11290492-Alexandrium_andersonii.AAC.1
MASNRSTIWACRSATRLGAGGCGARGAEVTAPPPRRAALAFSLARAPAVASSVATPGSGRSEPEAPSPTVSSAAGSGGGYTKAS